MLLFSTELRISLRIFRIYFFALSIHSHYVVRSGPNSIYSSYVTSISTIQNSVNSPNHMESNPFHSDLGHSYGPKLDACMMHPRA